MILAGPMKAIIGGRGGIDHKAFAAQAAGKYFRKLLLVFND